MRSGPNRWIPKAPDQLNNTLAQAGPATCATPRAPGSHHKGYKKASRTMDAANSVTLGPPQTHIPPNSRNASNSNNRGTYRHEQRSKIDHVAAVSFRVLHRMKHS